MRRMKLVVLAMSAVAGMIIVSCDSGDDGEKLPGKDVKQAEDVSGDDATTTPPGDVTEGDQVDTCTNECPLVGKTECVSDTTFHACGPNADACLVWGPAEACPANGKCDTATGACLAGCVDDCTTEGVKSCSQDGTAVMECKVGVDGCKHLSSVETCEAPAACVDGACSGGNPGGNDCKDIIICSQTCQNQACVEGCMQKSSKAGQDAFLALNQCGATACGTETQPAASQSCIMNNCGNEWTGCVGPWGSSGCVEMIQCANGCGMDADCQMDCLLDGSQKATLALWELQACLEANCSQCGNDQQCYQTCVQQKCMTEYQACTAN